MLALFVMHVFLSVYSTNSYANYPVLYWSRCVIIAELRSFVAGLLRLLEFRHMLIPFKRDLRECDRSRPVISTVSSSTGHPTFRLAQYDDHVSLMFTQRKSSYSMSI